MVFSKRDRLLLFIKKNRIDRVFYLLLLLTLIFPYQNCADTSGTFSKSLTSSSQGSTTLAPSNLTYSVLRAVYTRNAPITNNIPSSNGGKINSYAISPMLPAGLNFDIITGVISGTPISLSASADYVVTATNSIGTTSVVINITVNDTPQAGTIPSDCNGTKWYMSQNGSDVPSSNGLSENTPLKTFKVAFAKMQPGDVLILLDGTYSQANGNGPITEPDTGASNSNTTLIPSGVSLSKMTCVIAKNPGQVKVSSYFKIGNKSVKYSYIRIQGITFESGGTLFNTSYVTIKDSGFHGPFGIGTIDHHMGNTYNLIEDVWVWATGQRIVAINYRANYNVWRRVVVRGDGCGTANCTGSGNPNVGFTIYDSHDVSVQNMILIDRILKPASASYGGDSPYGDFASAQHTTPANPQGSPPNLIPDYYVGNAEWLGTMSINAPDTGYYLEPDETTNPTYKLINVVSYSKNAGVSGINVTKNAKYTQIENATSVTTNSGVAVRVHADNYTIGGILKNILAIGSGSYGFYVDLIPSDINIFGSFGSAFYSASKKCTLGTAGCYSENPQAISGGYTNKSLMYLTRIEDNSFLKAKAQGGADIGANILYRYGVDNTRHGEVGFNTLTNTPLWPYPNEARIKTEMSTGLDANGNPNTRGFCAASKQLDGTSDTTLTSYIWEMLGNQIPAEIYQ